MQILEKKQNVNIILSTVVDSIIEKSGGFGGIRVKNTDSGEITELRVDGMFVAIGQVPECGPFADVVALNEYGYVDAGEDCLPKSKIEGVFVAGDCRAKAIRQVTTATSDGAVAALAACRFIDSL